ncbi:unnamed protein product [Macrosiphum euphorbiae]|uniref:Uncharacterized protein n=1 Tax=Macrosiphum euphorbiae TaxID=13131 RepID=A0AAV0VWW3_9HEMI|nr:unnamed protein product [Macrosiphum euphorbiae]
MTDTLSQTKYFATPTITTPTIEAPSAAPVTNSQPITPIDTTTSAESSADPIQTTPTSNTNNDDKQN